MVEGDKASGMAIKKVDSSFVLKSGFGLPAWRLLFASVRHLLLQFAGSAARLAACAVC